jgi:glycosyltransferase involved in cell wall biosynthesis
LALAAFASIIDRFPEVRMSIAGDGPERTQLERQIAEWHLEGKVELLGWVAPDNVPALLNTATMVLMPSRWEGLPSVALQTAMMARPVVATSVGGLSEVVVHQHTGLLVPSEDHAELASAIAFLLEHPTIAVQMGRNARKRVQEVFGWQRCVDAYDALYRQLGGGQI